MRSSVYAAVRPFVRPSVQQQQIPGGSLDDDLRSYRPFSLRPPLVFRIVPFFFLSASPLDFFLSLSFCLHFSLALHLFHSRSARVCLSPSFFLLALAHWKAWRPNEDVSTQAGPRVRSCFRPPSVLVALTRQGGFLGPVQAVPSTSDWSSHFYSSWCSPNSEFHESAGKAETFLLTRQVIFSLLR